MRSSHDTAFERVGTGAGGERGLLRRPRVQLYVLSTHWQLSTTPCSCLSLHHHFLINQKLNTSMSSITNNHYTQNKGLFIIHSPVVNKKTFKGLMRENN